MKRFTLTLIALLALGFTLKAQQYVSTEPANRNVLIEEYTGRSCPYCPQGHAVANEIVANHPGRVFAVNYHSTSMGSLSPTAFPNLNLPVATTLMNAFGPDGIPMGVVNRSTATAQSRGAWLNLTNQQLDQAAECNVAGSVVLNPDTRVAQITVEIYYTANSTVGENYLTVEMLQDSIMGSQSGSSYNPSQVINGSYCHMHTLRDVVTNTWGDVISPTSQGTLITKTYEYHVPESIGSPNPVDVDINNIFFIAFVSERYQGSPTRPVLNVCELETMIGSNEPIYPMVNSVSIPDGNTCSQFKTAEAVISNIGTETLTSMLINVALEGGDTQTINWEGTLPQFGNVSVDIPLLVPFGTHDLTIEVKQANGVATQASMTAPVTCEEWVNLDVAEETERLKLMLVQDKWGAQITWEFTTANGEVIASGGPYNTLAGSAAILPHAEWVTVPSDECIMFTIHDSGNNGICCTDGDGYYKIFDSQNHIVIDGDGAFGSEAKHLINVNNTNAVEDQVHSSFKVYPNPAKDYLMVEGEMNAVAVYNVMGQCMNSQTVNGAEARISLAGMSNGIYFLRISSNGETVIRKFTVNR